MAKVGHVEVEVRPTVMLNLFLDGNEDYDLVCVNRGDGFKWELTDDVKPRLQTSRPSKSFAEKLAEANEAYRNMSDEEKRSLFNG